MGAPTLLEEHLFLLAMALRNKLEALFVVLPCNLGCFGLTLFAYLLLAALSNNGGFEKVLRGVPSTTPTGSQQIQSYKEKRSLETRAAVVRIEQPTATPTL
jgi:hypothetical protein